MTIVIRGRAMKMRLLEVMDESPDHIFGSDTGLETKVSSGPINPGVEAKRLIRLGARTVPSRTDLPDYLIGKLLHAKGLARTNVKSFK
jgi:hypothetical protein